MATCGNKIDQTQNKSRELMDLSSVLSDMRPIQAVARQQLALYVEPSLGSLWTVKRRDGSRTRGWSDGRVLTISDMCPARTRSNSCCTTGVGFTEAHNAISTAGEIA